MCFEHAHERKSHLAVFCSSSNIKLELKFASKSAFVILSWTRSHRTGWPCPRCLHQDASSTSGRVPTCCLPWPARTCRLTSLWIPSCASMLSQWYHFLSVFHNYSELPPVIFLPFLTFCLKQKKNTPGDNKY